MEKEKPNPTRREAYEASLREALWQSQRGNDRGVIRNMGLALEHLDGHGSVQESIDFNNLQLKLLENAHENWCLKMLTEAKKFTYHSTTFGKNRFAVEYRFTVALKEAAYVKGIDFPIIERMREDCFMYLDKPFIYRWLKEKSHALKRKGKE